jgi:hypothetical protein
MIRYVGSVCIIAVLLLTLSACESDPVGKTVPVKGKVMVNGKPLTTGNVVFWPDEAKGNKLSGNLLPTSKIAEDGTYDLVTKGKPGAPPGAYKITVNAQTEVDSTKPETAKKLVPDKYTSKDKTPLEKNVADGAAAGTYDLDLK